MKKLNKTIAKIEQNGSKKIEQIASEKEEISRNNISYIPHFIAYIKNITTPPQTTPFGINTVNQISI